MRNKGALIFFCRKGVAVEECIWTSFSKKVAVRPGSFKPERVSICCVYQDPVGFDVAVARRIPRVSKRMVSVVRRNWDAFGQEPNNLSQLIQVLPSFPYPFDITGKLFGLRDLLHFSQFLNIASTDSNSWISSPRRLFTRVDAVSSFGISTGKGKPPRRDICL
jgi:hypothetical protein